MIWNISQVLLSEKRSEGSEVLLDGLQKEIEKKWSHIPSNEIDKWLNKTCSEWVIESIPMND